MFVIQKFLNVRATADAANWFADNINLMVEGLQLYEENLGDPDFNDRVTAATQLWPTLMLNFVKKSPPQWPGQAEFLDQHGFSSLTFETDYYTNDNGISIEWLVRLCTEYFVSGFVRNCRAMDKEGDPRGREGLKALTQKIDDIFEAKNVLRFIRTVEKHYLG